MRKYIRKTNRGVKNIEEALNSIITGKRYKKQQGDKGYTRLYSGGI